jgi:hypothetical protein
LKKAIAGEYEEPEAVAQTNAPAAEATPTIAQDSSLWTGFSSTLAEPSPPHAPAPAQLNLPGIGAFSFVPATPTTHATVQTSDVGTGGLTFVAAAPLLFNPICQSSSFGAGSFSFAPAAPSPFQGWSPNPVPNPYATAQTNDAVTGFSFTFATPPVFQNWSSNPVLEQITVPEYDTGMDDVRNDHAVQLPASIVPSFDD